jgi:hypothetical protein
MNSHKQNGQGRMENVISHWVRETSDTAFFSVNAMKKPNEIKIGKESLH